MELLKLIKLLLNFLSVLSLEQELDVDEQHIRDGRQANSEIAQPYRILQNSAEVFSLLQAYLGSMKAPIP